VSDETYRRPDLDRLAEVELLVGNLAEELAGFRRRTQRAEAELQELKGAGAPAQELARARQRLIELETENQELRRRLEVARERVHQLAGRLSFLEQGGRAS